jgi:dTDP-4-amino-4,6-dideoxygalactose transaminase
MDNRQIPLVDLHAQYHSIKGEIDEAVSRVLGDCSFILGTEVQAFETGFAAFCGANHCIGVANGTDALELALEGLGVGPGDEVITVAHTFIATAEAILRVGAVPVFIDVKPDTLLMDPALIEGALTPRSKAILPVHLYGQCVDMDPIMEIARGRHLVVIEDACQAHGATYKGRTAGSLGDAAAFSFYPGKNLGAYGDAGAVTTSSDPLANWLRKARNHGRQTKYLHEFSGRNSRMAGLQGAVLSVKLRHLTAWNARRRALASELLRRLAPMPGVVPVSLAPTGESAHHLFVLQVDDRDQVLAHLQKAGIEAGIHYPVPLHRQPALQHLSSQDLPVTDAAAARILSLPLWPEMTEAHLDDLVAALGQAVGDVIS